MFFFVTLYLQQVLGYSPLQAGVAFLPTTLGVATASALAPRVIARIGLRGTLVAGMTSAAAGMALFSGVDPASSYATAVLPGSVLAAAGLGLGLVSATIVAVQGVPSGQSGLASGLVNSSRLMGGALGLAALSTLADGRTHVAIASGSTYAQALTDGYGSAFRAGAVACLAGAALAALLISRGPAPAEA